MNININKNINKMPELIIIKAYRHDSYYKKLCYIYNELYSWIYSDSNIKIEIVQPSFPPEFDNLKRLRNKTEYNRCMNVIDDIDYITNIANRKGINIRFV